MKENMPEAKANQLAASLEAGNEYRRCKPWELAAFAMNNSATNLINFVLMSYVAYYATGIMGLGTVIVSTIITSSRIWDAVTDPIVGLWLDRTDGRFGKFRPFMIMGNLTMLAMIFLLFLTGSKVPEGFRLIYFIVIYLVYIVGYTFQATITKSGQGVMTNDPKQRPLFSMFDLFATQLVFAGGAMYVSSYLQPKYGDFNNTFFTEFVFTIGLISFLLTILAVWGIHKYDRTEFFGVSDNSQKIGFREMFQILKGNKPLQMLIVAASTDKLGMTVSSNAIVMVMLFGVVIGDFSMYGRMSAVTMIPSLILILLGTRYASKMGSKKALVIMTWICLIIYSSMFLLLWLGNPSSIDMGNLNFTGIAFVVLYALAAGARTVAGGIVIPMIPDVVDYETYANNRYAPGVIGTLFSFVDKMVSSLGQTIIGITLAMIGFKEIFPSVETEYSTSIFWVTMLLYIGLLILAWIASLIAMRFYELDNERMEEIQSELEKRRGFSHSGQ